MDTQVCVLALPCESLGLSLFFYSSKEGGVLDQWLSIFGRPRNSLGGLLNIPIWGPPLRESSCPGTPAGPGGSFQFCLTVYEMNLEQQLNISTPSFLPPQFSPSCPNLATFSKNQSIFLATITER